MKADKTNKPAQDIEIDSEIEADDVAQQELQEQQDISDFLSEMSSEHATVEVRRKGAMDSTFAICGSFPIGEVNTEWLSKTMGGGTYLLRVRSKTGKWGPRKKVTIDSRIKGMMDADSGGSQTAEIVREVGKLIPARSGGNDMLVFMQMMQQQNQMMLTMMMESQKSSMTALTTIMAAAMGGGGKTDVVGLLEVMRKSDDKATTVILEMMKQRNNPKELIDMMAALKQLSGNDNGNDDMLTKLIAGGIGMLGMGAGKLMRPAASPPADVEPEGDEPPSALEQFKEKLFSAALENKPADLFASIILGYLDKQQLANMRDILVQENYGELLFPGDERFNSVRPWFDTLRGILLEKTKPAEKT